MSILITLFISLLFLVLSRLIFVGWFNHLSIYIITWGSMIFLYELKLLSFISLSSDVWFIVIITSLIFFIGTITPLVARNSLIKKSTTFKNPHDIIFLSNGKYIRNSIFILGVIGLIGAVHSWFILFQNFGNLTNILLSANDIYKIRTYSTIEGMIPYQAAINYSGLVLAGLYGAYRKKMVLVNYLPLIAALLRDLANFARVGILISFVIFIVSFLLYKNYLRYQENPYKKRINLQLIILVLLVVLSASIVRVFRGSYEGYKGANKQLTEMRTGLIISPSVYLYLSSHIGVFSKFLEKDLEITRIGENTFAPAYNFLAKFGITEKAPFHQKGYFIPMWSNSSTYLRELYADFGLIGLFLIPYIAGLISTLLYIKFYETGSIRAFVLLTCLVTVIGISFFSLIIRGPDIYFVIAILLLVFSIIEKLVAKSINTREI